MAAHACGCQSLGSAMDGLCQTMLPLPPRSTSLTGRGEIGAENPQFTRANAAETFAAPAALSSRGNIEERSSSLSKAAPNVSLNFGYTIS